MNGYKQKIDSAFEKFKQRIDQLQKILPDILSEEAVNYSLDAFKTESFNGIPWKKRKNKKDQSSNLLVKSGRLRRSIQTYALRANGFTLGSDVPYAQVHNTGGEINRANRSETFVRNRVVKGKRKGKFAKGTSSGQGLTFKSYKYNMPKRQFIGDTVALRRRLNSIVKKEYLKLMKN